ncbi:Transcription initiation protein SPT3 [Dermatophagoides pteronyssinus]|uniref:Transcription initiation protein SPT3 n=1 Tax=Dermatophagoides pteronyssinus TaxID=6956 RepID=A0ABQ8JN23_DERPT|nr:Transcription initiation protein SPT3 [Dermatophagoides pteronyssinus]
MAKNITTNAKESSANTSIRTNSDQSFASSSKQNVKRAVAKRIILNPSSDATFTDQSNSKCQQNCRTKKSTRSNQSSSVTNGHRIISYMEEIRRMMHAFGDVRQPLIESARMIESIVRHQMTMLLLEAQRVAQMRHSQSSSTTNTSRTHISVEDFIFLLKHDRHRLAKLIRYLKFKDMKLKVLSSSLVDSKEKSTKQSKISKSQMESLYNDVKSELQADDSDEWNCLPNGQGNVCDGESKSSSSFETSSSTLVNNIPIHQTNASTKRVKSCQEILRSVIQTPQNCCEMERLLYHHPDVAIDLIDDYTFARNRRLSEFTEHMSVKEYLYYQSCRSVTFFGSSTGSQTISNSMFQKFQDWILGSFDEVDRLELKPNSLGWEIVQYFAHETVAILVELALMVRHDQNRRVSRPGIDGGRPLYPTTIESQAMSTKRIRRELSMESRSTDSAAKVSKCDPMMNQINSFHSISTNNLNGLQKSKSNEQFVADILRRTSEKRMGRRRCSHDRSRHRSKSRSSSRLDETDSPHGYVLYYIDLLRYLLYISAFLILLNSFQLYADDFLGVYRKNKKSSVPTSTFFFLSGSLIAVSIIYSFRYDGLVYKLFIFNCIILSILFGRWICAPSYSGESLFRLVPYYSAFIISLIIILMVMFRLNDLTVCPGRRQKPIKHCHSHKNNDLSDDNKTSHRHFHRHHHHRRSCRSKKSERSSRRKSRETSSSPDLTKVTMPSETNTSNETSDKITVETQTSEKN